MSGCRVALVSGVSTASRQPLGGVSAASWRRLGGVSAASRRPLGASERLPAGICPTAPAARWEQFPLVSACRPEFVPRHLQCHGSISAGKRLPARNLSHSACGAVGQFPLVSVDLEDQQTRASTALLNAGWVEPALLELSPQTVKHHMQGVGVLGVGLTAPDASTNVVVAGPT